MTATFVLTGDQSDLHIIIFDEIDDIWKVFFLLLLSGMVLK